MNPVADQNEKSFENLFRILSEGTPMDIKEAKKCLEKKRSADSGNFEKSASVVFHQIKTFDSIKNPMNKAGVISGIKLFCLALADRHFSTLKDFIVKNLQDSDGRVREAARNTGDWIAISLLSRASPFIYPEGKGLTEKQKADQIIAEKQYIDFVKEIEVLIEKYDYGTENGVEYVSDMKPSIHKSLQQVWNKLTECPVYREILEKTRPIPFEIFVKRKEIETEILKLINMYKIDVEIDLDYVKQLIYEEDGTGAMQDLIAIFDNGNVTNLDIILEVVSDAWNYFPHKSLDGKSPQEKLLEYRHAKI